jgi:exosome complex component RRP45
MKLHEVFTLKLTSIDLLRRSVEAMSKETALSVAERDFILEALLQNVRLDGRDTNSFRPLSISFGEEYGHVKVRLGQTRLVLHFFSSSS